MRILHTADAHGAQQAYQAIRQESLADTLLLDAGDTLLGSNTAFRLTEPNLTLMSEIGYSAMTMGNRELHYVPAVLERRQSERNFPLLAANLIDLWGRQTTWQEGVSLQCDGVKVGVFGMTVVQYPVGSLYEKLFGLRFLPPETLIEYLVEKYQAQHDVVVFLSHLGIDWDRKLAQKLEAKKDRLRCDLILGGHTHTITAEPERYGHTLVSHVGSHGSGYGIWDYSDGDWSYNYHALKKAAVGA